MPSENRDTDAAETIDYKLDEQVGFILRRATQRHLALFADAISDLTPTQFAALAKLYELDPVSQNELGRQTSMDAATIKGVIDRLRNRGYVTTEPDPKDLRRIIVSPTPEGADIFNRCTEAAHRITEETLAPLNAREQALFLGLLKKLT